jgi:hypothetical protein
MKKLNIIDTMSLTCVLINIGLFFFSHFNNLPHLQMLSLFNVICFLIYFLIVENTNVR